MQHNKLYYVGIQFKNSAFTSKVIVSQYFTNKVDADHTLTQVKAKFNNIICFAYVDSIWKNDLYKCSFAQLHGRNIIKCDDILNYKFEEV